MDTVLLKSKDEETFLVTVTAAKLSKTVENLLSVMENDDPEPIPVLEVDSKILKMVVGWMNEKSTVSVYTILTKYVIYSVVSRFFLRS